MKNLVPALFLLGLFTVPAFAFNNLLLMKNRSAVTTDLSECGVDDGTPETIPAGWGYGGTGCVAGANNFTVTHLGGTTWKIKFKRFCARVPDTRSFERVSCNLAIPVSVPNKKQISPLEFYLKGRAKLETSPGSLSANAESFFAGVKGPTISATKSAKFTGEWTSDKAGKIWSKCGADVNLRVNASIRATGSSNLASVDEIPVYGYEMRDCP